MLLPRSELNAAPRARERLFPWWSMLLFGIVVALALLLFFPQRWLLAQVEQTHPGDQLNLQYLQALLEAQPDDVELRLALARQQLAGQSWQAASDTLQPLLDLSDMQARTSAELLQFDVLTGQLQALPVDAPARAGLLQQMWRLARSSQLTAARLTVLANEASAQGQHALAQAALDRLVIAAPDEAPRWLELSAQTALAQGQYQAAANRYFQALVLVRGLQRQRHLFLAGLRTLQSGNLLPQAVQAARQYGYPLRHDRDTLLFLIRLCRAAGDLDEAERYARQLLQMALLQELQRLTGIGQSWQPVSLTDSGKPPQAAFDQEAYLLGYEVMLGNRKPHDAYLIAERAVRHLPDDLPWRKRLAQAAEWDQQPALALQHWLWLAERGGDEQAWEGVLRLAPGLNDDSALMQAWRHKAQRGQFTEAEWRQLMDLYERNGEPLAGADFLLKHYAAHPDPLLLTLAAQLQQRAGADDAALQSYRLLAKKHGQTPERALAQATLLYMHSDLHGAYQVLQQAVPDARQAPESFWRTLGELAWQLDQREQVIHAYGQLLERQQYSEADLERLFTALQAQQPDAAISLAQRSWQQFGNPRHLLSALAWQIQQQQWQAARSSCDALTAAQRAQLQNSPQFFSLRAQIHQHTAAPQAALADARRALQLAPDDSGLRQALLWMLIDYRERDELRQRLQQWPTLGQDPAYRELLAAAWLTLGDAPRALPYFSALLRSRQHDPLWLMGYADALEQTVQPDLAWRVRRHIWQMLMTQRNDPARHDNTNAPLPKASPDLLLQARLALLFAPTEPTAGLMRQLLREDRDSRQISSDNAQAAELVLAWALSSEQHQAAKAWLLQRYAQNQQRPHWAALSLALLERDQQQLQQLLDQHADSLPVNDAIEAARLTGRQAQAQLMATQRLQQISHDDNTHAQLVDMLLLTASQASTGALNQRIGALNRDTRSLAGSVSLMPQLRLSMELAHSRQSARSDSLFSDLSQLDPALPNLNQTLPALDRQLQASLRQTDELGQTELQLGRRHAASRFNTLSLSRDLQITPWFNLAASAGRNEYVDYSERLIAYGVKDGITLGLRLTPSRYQYLSLGWRRERLLTQSRGQIGRARIFNWEAGHKLRLEYPDWTIRLSGYQNRFYGDTLNLSDLSGELPDIDISTDQARLLLPEDSRSIGLNLGFGQQYASDYSRTARLYADGGISYSSDSGVGYNWLLGVAGSVIGSDHLTAFMGRSWGGSQNLLDTRALGVKYKLHF